MSLAKHKFPLKRQVITLEEKIKILDKLNEGERISALSKSLKLNEATIRTIKKNEEKIRKNAMAGSSTISKRMDCARDINIVKMEEALAIWIDDCTNKRIPLDGGTIKRKALQIYNELKEMGDPSAHQQNSFSASKGWLENFKKRHLLHNSKLQGESASADTETTRQFARELLKIVEDRGYTTIKETLLTENNLIKIINEPYVDTIITKDSKNSSEESPSNISIADINEGLELAKKLEEHFMGKDSLLLRKRTFQRHLHFSLAPYFKLSKALENKNALLSKANFQNVVSDEEFPSFRGKRI